ncbi:MAG: hypothetical protein NVS3B10_04130 [Polyangiales bacterium]
MRQCVLVLAAVALLLVSVSAWAHQVGVSSGTWTVATEAKAATLTAQLTFTQTELGVVAPPLEGGGAVQAARADVQRVVVDAVHVTGDGAQCPGTLEDLQRTENDGVAIRARWTCAGSPQKVVVAIDVLAELSAGHRHFAHVVSVGAPYDVTLFRGNATLELSPGAASAPPPPSTFAMFRMGVEHILTGYDHLVFLLGLVLLGGRVRGLLGVITAFTVAHSITLALAALGVWAPSPRIIEPAIALSIAYVGVENLFAAGFDRARSDAFAGKRWRITFPFGLVHGFGFAGALQEIDLPRAKIPVALVMFNLGVEAGQLAVLAVVLPLVLWARRSELFAHKGVRAVSAVIVAAGLIWFVVRVRGA